MKTKIFVAFLCVIAIFAASCAKPTTVDKDDNDITSSPTTTTSPISTNTYDPNETESATEPSGDTNKNTQTGQTPENTGNTGTPEKSTNSSPAKTSTGTGGTTPKTSVSTSAASTPKATSKTTSKTTANTQTSSPTPTPVPTKAPGMPTKSTLVWPTGQALPSFSTPISDMDAINIRSFSFDTKVTMTSLQGVVNKKKPQILVLNDAGEGVDTWPKAVGLTYKKTTDYKMIIQKYAEDIKGMVVYNKSIPDTVNVATTIASIEDALVVSPTLASTLKAAPYNIKVIVDLNNVNISNKSDAYNYLYNNYWSKCTKRVIVGLKPDEHVGLRDLATATKAAVLWLDPRNSEEKSILDKFFKDTTPIDTYYAGWWPDEGSGVGYGSTYGVITVPADFYENYSVYSGQSRKLDIPTVPAKPTLQNDKIYVSLNMSDGDNIQYNQHVMRMNNWWGSSQRGKVPIGWTCSPALLDAGPQILNYYYKTATENDVLISGPSGLGYSSAENWSNESNVTKYAQITNSYFEKTAFNIITVWSTLSNQKANWLVNSMPSLLGLTTQNRTNSKIRFVNNDIPVVWFGSDFSSSSGAMSYDQGTGNIKTRLTAVASRTYTEPQFYAAQVKSWDTGVADLVNLVNDLNKSFPGRFVFVRPDHFMMLINEANGKPFNTALRKNVMVSSAASGYSASQAVDGSFTTGWKSASSGQSWLQIDLGQTYKISRYVLKNAETNYMSSGYNLNSWQIQVSTNGTSWNTIDTVSGNTKSIVYQNVTVTSARYIRINITNAGTDGVARIQDFEVYGAK